MLKNDIGFLEEYKKETETLKHGRSKNNCKDMTSQQHLPLGRPEDTYRRKAKQWRFLVGLESSYLIDSIIKLTGNNCDSTTKQLPTKY